MKRIILVMGLGFTFTVCATHVPRSEVKKNPITVSKALIEKVKAKGWLGHSMMPCVRFSLSKKQFQECILVDAASLPSFDPDHSDYFGKDYDPEKYYHCRLKKGGRNDFSCRRYSLRRKEPKPVWPYPEFKWPEAPKEPVYYPGITREDYFKGLCESEAGKFIYRTVDGVEGVYQIRPQYPERTLQMRDPYVMEDPYGFSSGESNRPGFGLLGKGGYQYFETSLYDPWALKLPSEVKKYYAPSFLIKGREDMKYFRYEGVPSSKTNPVVRYQSKQLKSSYAYVWRGIKRKHDREMGIAGSEIAIVDLRNNELLALLRGFSFTSFSQDHRAWWLGSAKCPSGTFDNGTVWEKFLKEVLKPKIGN